ncbi:hypothetical protein [Propionivibrio dicarboxylicus]|uniref:hypothetical protein n=1 Tax=Propionivibrio dicarboxylicus TaxID=83767 RepID=UPI000B877CD8|nr:hypothetical protein [Propionivibrio dicarboxylicus]
MEEEDVELFENEMLSSEDSCREAQEAGKSMLEKIMRHLRWIDAHIDVGAELLERLQPPADGKISIRWARRSGRIVPQPVMWKITKIGKQGIKKGAPNWRYERLGLDRLVNKLRKTKGFEDTHEETKLVMGMVVDLLERRRQIMPRIYDNNRIAATTIFGHEDPVTNIALQLNRLNRTIPERKWEVILAQHEERIATKKAAAKAAAKAAVIAAAKKAMAPT